VLAAALAQVVLGGRPTVGVGLASVLRPDVGTVIVDSPTSTPTASALLAAGAAGVAAAALALGLAQLQLGHPLLFVEEQMTLAVLGNHRLALLLDGTEHAGYLLHGDGLDDEQGLD
jgi:hypothetical protein